MWADCLSDPMQIHTWSLVQKDTIIASLTWISASLNIGMWPQHPLLARAASYNVFPLTRSKDLSFLVVLSETFHLKLFLPIKSAAGSVGTFQTFRLISVNSTDWIQHKGISEKNCKCSVFIENLSKIKHIFIRARKGVIWVLLAIDFSCQVCHHSFLSNSYILLKLFSPLLLNLLTLVVPLLPIKWFVIL